MSGRASSFSSASATTRSWSRISGSGTAPESISSSQLVRPCCTWHSALRSQRCSINPGRRCGCGNLFRGLLILPWVFSTAAAGLMWTLLYHPFGILNYVWIAVLKQSDPLEFLAQPGMALASLTIVNTWKAYPIYMIFILGGLQAIPQELYEAAKVDGASAWQRFMNVTVPQLRTVLLAISSLDFVTTMGHVDLIRLLTRGGPLQSTETTPFYIFKTALIDGNLGYGAAVATLLMCALAIFTVFYLRMLSRGAESDGTSF